MENNNRIENGKQKIDKGFTGGIGLVSFAIEHPFITMFIIGDVLGAVNRITSEIGKSVRYRSYLKGYDTYADRLADLRSLEQPTKPWDFEAKKQEKEEKEKENTDEEKDTADSNDDSDVSDIFSDDTGSADRRDDDLHG